MDEEKKSILLEKYSKADEIAGESNKKQKDISINIENLSYYEENEGHDGTRTFRDLSTNHWYFEDELVEIFGFVKINELKEKYASKKINIELDVLVLVEYTYPTQYEVYRKYVSAKNLLIKTVDKDFAVKLVNSYNTYNNNVNNK